MAEPVHELHLLEHVAAVGAVLVHLQHHHLAGAAMRDLKIRETKHFIIIALKKREKTSKERPRSCRNQIKQTLLLLLLWLRFIDLSDQTDKTLAAISTPFVMFARRSNSRRGNTALLKVFRGIKSCFFITLRGF